MTTPLKEFAGLVQEYLLLQKRIAQVESWVEALGDDRRVHGKVITNGAVTGRMIHMSPNMAQVPRVKVDKKRGVLEGYEGGFGAECRACWVADEGKVLLGCDASGLELRMLAHYMQDSAYTEAVVHGDIHTVNMNAAGLQSRDQAKTFISMG